MKKLTVILAGLLAASVLLVSCASDEKTDNKADKEKAPVSSAGNMIEGTPNEIVPEEIVTPGEIVTPDDIVTPDEIVPDAPAASGLQTVVDSIYEKYPLPFMVGTIPAEMITEDSYTYYTGLADVSAIDELLVSESMIGSQAYSLVLAEVKDGQDVNAVADAMINGIDQRKWMCVEADLIRTVTHGNTVMLVMIDSAMEIPVDGFVTAFEEVVGAVEYEATKA